MTQRGYRATYKRYGDRYGVTFRDLIAPDSFLDAVEMAENMGGDGELLVNPPQRRRTRRHRHGQQDVS